MEPKNGISGFEDIEQLDALSQFAPSVRDILREYRKQRQLSRIAKQLGYRPARLTEMITKNGDGQYKRKISPYYLAKFIDSGVMDTSEILGDRKLEDLPDRLQLFFERMLLSRETIRLVLEAQRRGIDIDRILHEILYPNS
jgi:hypothetical protein